MTEICGKHCVNITHDLLEPKNRIHVQDFDKNSNKRDFKWII